MKNAMYQFSVNFEILERKLTSDSVGIRTKDPEMWNYYQTLTHFTIDAVEYVGRFYATIYEHLAKISYWYDICELSRKKGSSLTPSEGRAISKRVKPEINKIRD